VAAPGGLPPFIKDKIAKQAAKGKEGPNGMKKPAPGEKCPLCGMTMPGGSK